MVITAKATTDGAIMVGVTKTGKPTIATTATMMAGITIGSQAL